MNLAKVEILGFGYIASDAIQREAETSFEMVCLIDFRYNFSGLYPI